MKSNLLVFIFLILPLFTFAQFDADIEPHKVIVKYKYAPTAQAISLSDHTQEQIPFSSQRSLFPQNFTTNNHRVLSEIPDVYNIYELEFSSDLNIEEVILKLMEDEAVEYAEPSYRYELLESPNDPLYSSQLIKNLYNIEEVWALTKGDSNIVIGIIDTGTQLDHEDLAGNLYYNEAEKNGVQGVDDDNNGYIDDINGYDFAENDNNPSIDNSSHGLTVAGSAVAISNNGTGISGVAPLCKYMPLKVETNSGSLINVSEAMIYGAMNGCKVINLSLGRAFNPARYEQEIINYLTETYDVLFVAAAGNTSASHTDYYPASYENVISVTGLSHTYNNLNYKYSHRIDVANLGSGVHVTGLDNTYSTSNGTSYASPLTSGVAALIAAYNPDLRMEQIGELIRTTSDTTIYDNASNSSLKGLLGKGFVKPLNALHNIDNALSVRMLDISANTANGDVFNVNDEIYITAQFKNYLNESSDQLTVSIEYEGSEFEIIDGEYTLGSLNELEKTNIEESIFTIRMLEDVNEGVRFSFKLIFSDPSKNYYDEQYFYITPKQSRLLLYLNNFAGYFKSDGSLGLPSSFFHRTASYRRFMYQFGAVIAQNEQTVSDAIREESDLYATTDFSANHAPSYYEREDHRASLYTAFNDYERDSAHSNQLDIEMIAYGNKDDEQDDFLLIDLKLKNTSNQTIDSLYTGMFINWLLSGSTGVRNTDIVTWDANREFVYVHNLSSDKHAAFKVLNDHKFYQSFNRDTGNNSIDLSDGFSDIEKFSLMTNGVDSTPVGESSGANIGSMLGAKLYNISPQETQRVVFVLAITNVSKSRMKSILTKGEEFAADFLNYPYADTYWDGSAWINGTPSEEKTVKIGANSPNTSFTAKKIILEKNSSLNIPSGEEVTVSETIISDSAAITGGGTLYLSNPNGEIEVINDLSIENILKLESNTKLKVNQELHLKDGAIFLHNSTSQLQGNIRLHRSGHDTHENAYNYLSLPTVNRSLHDSISSADRYYFNEAGTDDGINDNGNDVTYTPDDASDDVWQTFTEGNQLAIGKGFIASNIGEVEVVGNPSTGLHSVAVTASQSGYNLLGNPYTAPIDIESFLTHTANAEIDGSVWIFSEGSYDCFNLLNKGEIPTFQGFFVKATTSGNIEFTNDMKVNSVASNSLKRVSHGDTGFSIFELHVAKEDSVSDKVIFGFDEIFSDSFDENYDALKLKGSQDLNVYVNHADEEYAILALPPVDGLQMIDLRVETENAQELSFHYTTREDHLVPEGIFLKDNVNRSYTLLDPNEGIHTIEVLENDPVNRFQLLFAESLDQILAVQQGLENELEIKVSSNEVHLEGNILSNHKKVNVSVYNLLGQTILKKEFNPTHVNTSLSFHHNLQKSQVYILLVDVGEQQFKQRIILK